ncbi:hypothetical protein KXD40_006761 [Peronospora effusa]|nr:hypothetical protein KXD40_006761 [Peronospora effusa]
MNVTAGQTDVMRSWLNILDHLWLAPLQDATQVAYQVRSEAKAVVTSTRKTVTDLTATSLISRHLDDMAKNEYMAHDGSDGSLVLQRVTEAGYELDCVAGYAAASQEVVEFVMQE